MTAVLAATRMHLAMVASRPIDAIALMTTPLLSVVFASVGRAAGREDFLVTAITGAGLIGLWVLTVNQTGDLISTDRWQGTLELLLAVPASLSSIVLGRLSAVVAIGTLAFAESYLVATVVFGASIEIHHPVIFAVTLLVTLVAIAGTACLLAPLFVLSRNTVLFEVVLTYPFYILGAVLFPVELLPEWLRPVSDVVFLSWSSQLLRDAAGAAPVAALPYRLGALLVLGLAAYVTGHLLTNLVVRRIRRDGTVGHA
ncbi:ABC transporter permease [Planotetraspora sp. GP83]|uniref:ABC transporter permease n=1 Tax=Planotetraspora sp. GP83 TaxID=3156264 RepID=UPI003515A1CA